MQNRLEQSLPPEMGKRAAAPGKAEHGIREQHEQRERRYRRSRPEAAQKIARVRERQQLDKESHSRRQRVRREKVPQRNDIGSRIYVLTCPISSYVLIFIAARNPISAKMTQLSTSTARKSGENAICAPKSSASATIMAEEMRPRSTAASTLPMTNAGGQIGAMRYSSRLL